MSKQQPALKQPSHADSSTSSEPPNGFSRYFDGSRSTFLKDYEMDKNMLGDGAFSVVHRAVRVVDDLTVAVKIIKKSKVTAVDLQREVEIWRLASSSSSRVVQLFDIYEDFRYVYLVMELCTGGELFEKIVGMTDYNEGFAAKIMKQIFLIIRDLHKVDIIHQDLKPENLLLMSKDSMILKLCDFGLAEIADDDTELFGCVGSTTYMAPEVSNETGHHKPVDMYAAGVIMYILLCGYPPFEPENGIVDLEFPDREWADISPAAKELITSLLDASPERRGTPEIILKHKWFFDVETVRQSKPLVRTVNTLRKYQEIGPTGSMKEYRGEGAKRTTVIGLFDTKTPESEETEFKKTNHAGGVTKKPPVKPTEISPLISKPSQNIPPVQTTMASPTPQPLPSPQAPQSTSPRKKGRNDQRKPPASTDSISTSSKSAAPKKKKKHQGRLSMSIVDLLTVTGRVDFDPFGKGVFDANKKNWVKNYQLDIEQRNRYEAQLEQYEVGTGRKREERKSQKKQGDKNSKRSSASDHIKKSSASSGYSNNSQAKFGVEDSMEGVDSGALFDLIASFHRELRYQHEMIESMKNEFTSLQSQVDNEIEQSRVLAEKLQSEIDTIQDEAKEEQKERRHMQLWVESQQNQAGLPSPTPSKIDKVVGNTQISSSIKKKKPSSTKPGHEKK